MQLPGCQFSKNHLFLGGEERSFPLEQLKELIQLRASGSLLPNGSEGRERAFMGWGVGGAGFPLLAATCS